MPSILTACLLLPFLPSLYSNNLAIATQPCYYPNGDVSTEDVPCSTSGINGATICCPLNWECMSDGLCYLPNMGFYERHTCSDRSWPSAACPRICTADMSAAGNEAMLLCASGEWCCDGNRSWNCCNASDTRYFRLPPPHPFASISVTPSVSTLGSSRTTSTTSATTITSVTSSTSSTSSTVSATTHASIVVTTASNGATKTVTTVVVSSAQANATDPQPTSKHSSQTPSNTAIIVGLAVGIPLICSLGAMTFLLLYRHYRTLDNSKSPSSRPSSPPTPANYQPIMPGTHAPELAGYPVAETKSGRESELYGSDTYISPTPSRTTSQIGAVSPLPEGSSMVGMAGNDAEKMAHIPEEPQELWGGYVPYRPPLQTHEELPEEDGVVGPITEEGAETRGSAR